MPKLKCPCGYVHDLSPVPDEGWVTVRDKDYERLVGVEISRLALSMAKQGSSDWNGLVEADAELQAMHGVMYECPECGRLMWNKPGEDTYVVYSREMGAD